MRIADASKSRAVNFTAAVTVSLASLFAGAPVSAADPYDDDGGGSSYDGGGAAESSGGGQEAPGESGGAQDAPGESGAGQEAPTEGAGGQATPEQGDGGGEVDAPDQSGDGHDHGGTHDDGGTHEGGDGQAGVGQAGGGQADPTELDAPESDVTTAQTSTTTQVTTTTSTEEVTTYQQSITSTMSTSTLSATMALSSPVSVWNSSWLSYDTYYRPVFANPYRIPLQVIYDYGGGPQTFTVPPLQRAVIDVPNAGVYSFTAATKPASGPPTNVSVGSFSGGGFQPAPGQAPPQKPVKLNTTKNALVQVKFDRGTSEPFRVSSLTDLGKDPSAKNTTKVLLDEEIPAWGEWSKTSTGEALFVITTTQLLPGVSRPGQEPLPGYNIKLAAAEQSTSWFSKNSTILIIAGVGVLALVAAIVLFVVPKRRRTTDQ